MSFTKLSNEEEEDYYGKIERDSTNIYVSAIVPSTDDPSTPSLTFRVIVLGTLWNILLASANSIFMFRTNSFAIPSTVATLLSYPMGIMMARTLPSRSYKWGPYNFSFNPGAFSIKEHVLITIIAAAGGGVAYGVDNVVVQKFKRFMGNQDVDYFNSLAFVMSVQLIGFGLAGILRRFLVKPAAMYWPATLSQVALFVGFHEKVDGREIFSSYKLSRYKFFWLSTLGVFIYSWIPQYFMTILQSFSIVCLLTSNQAAKFLSSTDLSEGAGIFSLTADFYYAGGQYLTSPFYASLQLALSNILWGWIIVPILFFSNAFGKDQQLNGKWTLNDPFLYNRNGEQFNPVDLLHKKTFDLNETAYQEQGPIYITTLFAVSYGTSFMAITAAISHVFLWYGESIWKQFKAALAQRDEEKDVHNRLMEAYPDVPDWVFLAFLISMIVIQIIVSVMTPFTMPIWSVFLCVGITMLFLLPIGIIQAITGLQLGLNVLTEFVIGLLIPGQTVAVMAFKSLGTNTIIQALSLLGDLKLGHYMKINPLHMVTAQFYGTIIGAILNNSFSLWAESLLSNVMFISPDWNPVSYDTFYSAGAIWGAIGPQRFFGIGSIYESLLWFFLYGATLPLIPWIGNRFYTADFWHYINVPILATGYPNPGSFQNSVVVPLILSWMFQYYIFNHNYEWWKKYNYVLSVAIDSGVSLAQLAIAVLAQNGYDFPIWAGNPETSLDYYCFNRSWKRLDA